MTALNTKYVYPVLQHKLLGPRTWSMSGLFIKPLHPIIFMSSTQDSPLAEADWVPYIVVFSHLFYRRAWILFVSWPVFLLCNIAWKRSEASTDDRLASAYDGTSLGISRGLGCHWQARFRDRQGMDSFNNF